MQALTLTRCDGTREPLAFNTLLTAVSLLAVVAIVSISLQLLLLSAGSAGRSVYAMAAADSEDAKGVVKPARGGGKRGRRGRAKDGSLTIWGVKVYLRFRVGRLLLATLLLATGAFVMHYMGMIAQFGAFNTHFSFPVVLVSGVLAVVVAGAGLFIVLQVMERGSDSIAPRVVAAFIIALAVNSMHYTGMSSATYIFSGDVADAMTHGLGATLGSPRSSTICAVAFAFECVQLSLCQHYNAVLYQRQRSINALAQAKVQALARCTEIMRSGDTFKCPLAMAI